MRTAAVSVDWNKFSMKICRFQCFYRKICDCQSFFAIKFHKLSKYYFINVEIIHYKSLKKTKTIGINKKIVHQLIKMGKKTPLNDENRLFINNNFNNFAHDSVVWLSASNILIYSHENIVINRLFWMTNFNWVVFLNFKSNCFALFVARTHCE